LLFAAPASAQETAVLFDADGSEVVLRPADGEVLLLHFWATWCPTCGEDMAALERVVADCSASRVRVFAVNVGDSPEAIAEFVRHHELGLRILRDPRGRVWRRFDGRGVPMNLFWEAERVRTEVGPKNEPQWRRDLWALGCDERSNSLSDDPQGGAGRPPGEKSKNEAQP